jgi:hypothetical protein
MSRRTDDVPWSAEPAAGGWRLGMLARVADDSDPPASGRWFHDRSPVIKLGGSLLRLPDWPRRVRMLLDALGGSPAIVVGGGTVVDGIRAIDATICERSDRLDALVHRLAIEAMGITARLAAHAVGLPLAEEIPVAAAGRPAVVLDTPAWLSRDDRLAALPTGWHVTSDSISAAVAAECGRGLLLAKSVPPPPCPDGDAPARIASLAAAGWVDRFFPAAAGGLRFIAWAAPLPEA